MGKMDRLTGVANNLAHSVISSTNRYYLRQFESLPLEKTSLIEIDLLKERIKPEDLMTDSVRDMMVHYRKWFILEMEKLNIGMETIDKVIVQIKYLPTYGEEKHIIKNYICNAIITAKGKDYSKETKASWR